jgi:ABC-2 type transport system permease protein
MIRSTFLLELRRGRTLTFWLSVVTVLYGGTMALFYPVMAENTKLLDDYMKVFPKAMLAAFGMEGSLSNHGIYFTTYIGSWLWPILAAIVGIVLGTRVTAGDHDRGFLDLPLATPMSRVRYLSAAIAGQVVVVFVVALASFLGFAAAQGFVGAGFSVGNLLLGVPLAFAFGCALTAVATLLGIVTLSRGMAAGITTGVLIVMYLLHVVSKLDPDLDWIGTASAFRYFNLTPIVNSGTLPLGDLALFSGIALGAWLLALLIFRRRDLAG